MFMLAHKDNCLIVLRGPTEEGEAVQVLDGLGGWKELERVYPTKCSCGGVLVQVDLMVPDDQSQPATIVSSTGGCKCQ